MMKEKLQDIDFGNIWVMVYKDTINHRYNGDDNLVEILISENILRDYYDTYASEDFSSYEDFKENYTCEETERLYLFATERNGMLAMRAF